MSAVETETTASLSDTARWLRSLGTLQGKAPAFDVHRVPDEPSALFLDWLREAVREGAPEPLAATLATVDADGMPDARTLILKDVGVNGWAVAGPRSSRKAEQLAANPAAALNFWWQPVLRAVRVRGTVREATRAQIEADLAARPSGATISVDDWMVWWIDPVRVEFWQGVVSRNHLRLVYARDEGAWMHDITGGESEATTEDGGTR